MGINKFGWRSEEELISILSEELAKSIDREIVDTLMIDVIKEEIKITNRDRKIESIINDKEYIEMTKEDHPYNKKKKN